MKLHELSPVEGSKKDSKRIGEATAQAGAKLPVKVIRARRLVQAAASVPDFRAVRCLYSVVSLKVVSTTMIKRVNKIFFLKSGSDQAFLMVLNT